MKADTTHSQNSGLVKEMCEVYLFILRAGMLLIYKEWNPLSLFRFLMLNVLICISLSPKHQRILQLDDLPVTWITLIIYVTVPLNYRKGVAAWHLVVHLLKTFWIHRSYELLSFSAFPQLTSKTLYVGNVHTIF
jgi:hypothetical protein